jgi:hypothetical protein
VLRRRIDHDAFDAAILALEAVAADLGYGDVRPLPGTVTWTGCAAIASGSPCWLRESASRLRWSWPASPTASTSS